jgi:hypothetical protein
MYVPILGKLSDNTSESGLCVILSTAILAQFQEKVLTKSGIEDLIHDMIKKNQDRSLVNELRRQITGLMLALSQKYSSECINDSLAVYPSLFDSINDDSIDSGNTSSQLTLSSFDTADSDWQLSRKKRCRTKSPQPVSDTDSQSTVSQDTDNYTSDSTSQGSNNQENYHRDANASLNDDDNKETGDEDATIDSDIQQFEG